MLLFDADCGFCTRVARLAGRTLRNVVVAPMQGADLAGLGVDVARAQCEMPFVALDGRVSYGSEGIAAALVANGGWPALVGRILRLPLIRSVARQVYRRVAEHRHQLPGGTPACALPNPPR